LGDGFVEAVADQTLIDLAAQQCKSSHRKICGQVLQVPIVEAPGQMSVGRFVGKTSTRACWSFAGDAYLNEMGITNRLQPDEVTKLCNTAWSPMTRQGQTASPTLITSLGLFEPRKRLHVDSQLASSAVAKKGDGLFDKIGCAILSR